MRFYKEVIISETDATKREILLAELAVLGFDGFEEDTKQLKAYIANEEFNGVALDALAEEKVFEYRVNTIQEKNWNEEWESSFSPVVVDDLVAVRAHFHAPIQGPKYEIVITPKMSFGTGHHATTWLMMKAMGSMELQGKKVLDFGTGTGVLAILAEKMGADGILAIDNDHWSIENTKENLEQNQSRKVDVRLADQIPAGETYDVVLANINKHVLLACVNDICNSLAPNGVLALSGVLSGDLQDIKAAYVPLLGEPIMVAEQNNWLAITFLNNG
jgi:ribosomal protein L11 methyltransferase